MTDASTTTLPIPTQQEIDFLEEHYPYEVDMLRYTLDTLLTTEWNDPLTDSERRQVNALIESYATHARNLIDFLWSHSSDKEFGSKDFVFETSPMSTKRDFPEAIRKAYGLMHDQILHIRKSRVRKPASELSEGDIKKLTTDAFKLMANEIEAEIEAFHHARREEFAQLGPPVRGRRSKYIVVDAAAPSSSSYAGVISSNSTSGDTNAINMLDSPRGPIGPIDQGTPFTGTGAAGP